MRSLSDYQRDYHHRGYTVLRGIALGVAAEWRSLAYDQFGLAAIRLDTDGGEAQAGDEGGAYRHALLDGETVRAELPGLYGFYQALPHVAAPIVCRPIVLSPYPRSAVNVKLYDQEGDTQGWHRDTNAVTALLYLTDDGHPTVVENLFGVTEELEHGPGDLLLMQGRRCRHWVPPLPAGVSRLTCPLNLYHPDDTWRPEGVDDVVYGAVHADA